METPFQAIISERYELLKSKGRIKTMPPHGTRSLSSNDYLGLSRHPRVIESSIRAVQTFGTGGTGSRYLSGNHPLHGELSEMTLQFKSARKSAIHIFSSGYHANLAVMSLLAEISGLVFSDSENHASIIDGLRNFKGNKIVYPHNDADFIRDSLARKPGKHPVIVTESLFSMRGDIAPLTDLLNIVEEHDGLLVIDEAHATGTTGMNGRGALEAQELPYLPNRMIIVGTYSKALGSLGGFVILDQKMASILASTARTLIYTTALPPGVLAASLESLRILDENPALVHDLRRQSHRWQRTIKNRDSFSPLIPLEGDVKSLQKISRNLMDKGLHLPVITYPTVPRGEAILRLSVNLGWGPDIDEALEKIFLSKDQGDSK